jgi:CRISPR-associated endonuclease/helicase Cas3
VGLPLDIRVLIEATYVKQAETGKMQGYYSELEEKRKKLEQLARYGLSKAGETLSESAATRYSEQDTVQVLLLSCYQTNANNTGTEITLLTGEKILLPRGVKHQDKMHWRELAAKLLNNTVQVTNHLAPQAVSIKELSWLSEFFYLGNPEFVESLLRVALVNESDEIKSLVGGVALEGCQLYYNKRQGYHVKK